MTRSVRPLTLGMDIEEVYDVFGEGIIFHHVGLPLGSYEQLERQAQRARDAMLDLGCPPGLVQRFEAAAARVNRSGEPPPGGLEGLRLIVETTARDLGNLMEEVRGHLAGGDAELYDLGVMLSRLGLCLRVVGSPVPDDPMLVRYRETYLAELARVVPIVTEMVLTVQGQLGDELEPALQQSLSRLDDHLARWDGGSHDWCRTASERTEEVFGSIGVVLGKVAVASSDTDQTTPAPDENLVPRLRELRYRVYQLYLEGDLANAEKGQRLLIDDCRKTIGPRHELTLAVRNDLALTLLSLGRGDLAADRAYDVSEDAERFLGAREPASAREQIRTLFILMSTKEFDECIAFFQGKLSWLADAEPGELDPRLVDPRQELLKLIGR
jgi:hypothetical protein